MKQQIKIDANFCIALSLSVIAITNIMQRMPTDTSDAALYIRFDRSIIIWSFLGHSINIWREKDLRDHSVRSY